MNNNHVDWLQLWNQGKISVLDLRFFVSTYLACPKEDGFCLSDVWSDFRDPFPYTEIMHTIIKTVAVSVNNLMQVKYKDQIKEAASKQDSFKVEFFLIPYDLFKLKMYLKGSYDVFYDYLFSESLSYPHYLEPKSFDALSTLIESAFPQLTESMEDSHPEIRFKACLYV